MLEAVAHYNNLSAKLRKELSEKINGFGKNVRFKFKIEKENPDKEKRDGTYIWPSIYTLDPATFDILDGDKRVKIGLVRSTDEKGMPNSFKKVQVKAGERGVKLFDLTDPDEIDTVAMLLLHPKLEDGQFRDKNRIPMLSIIDERKLAVEKNTQRSLKLKAGAYAEAMSEVEVVEFADAMVWDSTQEPEVLRSLIMDMAEFEPADFLKMTEDKKSLEYRANIKKAMDKQIIGFNPAEWKFVWSANNQDLAVLQAVEGKGEVEQLASWLIAGGDKADATYKKIKGLLK
jgi:hypothetical protein